MVSTKTEKNEKEAEWKTKPDGSSDLEEKIKIKEKLVASSYIENDVADNPRIQSHSSQETCPENYEPPKKKKEKQ